MLLENRDALIDWFGFCVLFSFPGNRKMRKGGLAKGISLETRDDSANLRPLGEKKEELAAPLCALLLSGATFPKAACSKS